MKGCKLEGVKLGNILVRKYLEIYVSHFILTSWQSDYPLSSHSFYISAHMYILIILLSDHFFLHFLVGRPLFPFHSHYRQRQPVFTILIQTTSGLLLECALESPFTSFSPASQSIIMADVKGLTITIYILSKINACNRK